MKHLGFATTTQMYINNIKHGFEPDKNVLNGSKECIMYLTSPDFNQKKKINSYD